MPSECMIRKFSDPGSKYCCLACSLNTNNDPDGPVITHIALQRTVEEVTLPPFFTGPTQTDPESHLHAFYVYNVHGRVQNHQFSRADWEHPHWTLDLCCKRCKNQLGTIYTDSHNIGESYRLYLLDREKLILKDENVECEPVPRGSNVNSTGEELDFIYLRYKRRLEARGLK